MDEMTMETQLLLPNDLGYIRYCSIKANRRRQGQRTESIDTLAREQHKQLMTLERVIIEWFGRLTPSKNERILRYKSSNGVLKYQEIDFIAESSAGLKFCELKLKQKFKTKLNDKSSGLAQLAVTTGVAEPIYPLHGSLAINIDMSYLYTGASSSGAGFTKVSEFREHFKSDVVGEHIWLDIEEILPILLAEGWITSSQITDIREVYELMQNPMNITFGSEEIPLNNPFGMLR